MHNDCNIKLCIKYNCDNDAKVEEHSTNSGGQVVLMVELGRLSVSVKKTCASPLEVSCWGAIACDCQPKYSCILAKHMHISLILPSVFSSDF